VVDKDITQANIAINQPFVKRPHPDYYPAAVASFILGGGSFTSRLMNRVRSDEGLAYSIYSTVGNDYRDTAMTTIALQTKVETVDFALKLIFEEVEKLAKEGPSAEELEQAKKALIESLPSLFDSPSATATIFAKGELLGKTYDHYLDYVKEINAVTADQVKAMIAKYFARDKMTISIVGPVSKFDALKPFTVIPQDSLDFR
jgi:zinc protease